MELIGGIEVRQSTPSSSSHRALRGASAVSEQEGEHRLPLTRILLPEFINVPLMTSYCAGKHLCDLGN